MALGVIRRDQYTKKHLRKLSDDSKVHPEDKCAE